MIIFTCRLLYKYDSLWKYSDSCNLKYITTISARNSYWWKSAVIIFEHFVHGHNLNLYPKFMYERRDISKSCFPLHDWEIPGDSCKLSTVPSFLWRFNRSDKSQDRYLYLTDRITFQYLQHWPLSSYGYNDVLWAYSIALGQFRSANHSCLLHLIFIFIRLVQWPKRIIQLPYRIIMNDNRHLRHEVFSRCKFITLFLGSNLCIGNRLFCCDHWFRR